MAHDAAKFCCLGEAVYSALDDTKLHYPEKRQFLADRFRQDNRMMDLASLHRAKRALKERWTKEMRAMLRRLAADALQRINDTGQGAPAPQPIDRQMREVASGALPVTNDKTQGAAAAQPVDSQMREVASDVIQNCTAQWAAATQSVDSRNIIDGYGDEGSLFDIDGAIGPEDGAAPENWPHTKEALRSISPELPELSLEVQLNILWNENARLEAENRKLQAVWSENARLKAEISELKAVWGEKARVKAEVEVLKARSTSQRFPEDHGLQSSGDYQAVMPRDFHH